MQNHETTTAEPLSNPTTNHRGASGDQAEDVRSAIDEYCEPAVEPRLTDEPGSGRLIGTRCVEGPAEGIQPAKQLGFRRDVGIESGSQVERAFRRTSDAQIGAGKALPVLPAAAAACPNPCSCSCSDCQSGWSEHELDWQGNIDSCGISSCFPGA